MSGGFVSGAHFGEVVFHLVESSFSQAVPVFSGPVLVSFPVYTGFFGFLGDLDETWNLQSLGCTIHSGLLIQMRGVLQGVSGGALWVVR